MRRRRRRGDRIGVFQDTSRNVLKERDEPDGGLRHSAECRRVGRDLTAGAEKYCNMSLRKRAWTVSAWTVLFISGPLESAVLYGCVAFGGIPYRAKTTLKFFRDATAPTKAYSYEVSNIEVLKGIAAPVALPSDKTSIDVGILLNGVCDVNGAPLLAKRK